MTTTLTNFWLKNRKAILLGALLFGLVAFLLPHIVHAQGAASPTASPSTVDQITNDTLSGMSKILEVIKRIFWPVLLMIGGLMQNDILFGAGMEQRLLEIWVNVRNVVNVLFVVILLAIALFNVLGAGENYHFKTILPKFVIALIAVNFTFIGAKFVLDAVNIVSTAVFALPDAVQETLTKQSAPQSAGDAGKVGIMSVDDINGLCGALYGGKVGSDEYIANLRASAPKATGTSGTEQKEPTDTNSSICTDKPDSNGSYLNTSNPKLVNFFSKMNAQNVGLVMAISLQRANLLDTVKINNQKLTMGNLFVNVLFSIILFIVYGTAYIALFICLLIRLVVLWLLIAISPLIVLPNVLPESVKSMLGEAGEIWKKFLQNAIVPIPVALVMSIGFIMLKGLQGASLASPAGAGAATTLVQNPTLNVGLLTSGVSSLQQLLVALGAVAFIWMGVFQAMKGTYAEEITNSMKGFVEGSAKTLAGFAVKSIPLFPVGKGQPGKKGLTLGGLTTAVHQIPNMMSQSYMDNAQENLPEFMRGAGALKVGDAKDMPELVKRMNGVTEAQWPDKTFQGEIAKYFDNHKAEKLSKLQPALANSAKYRNKPEEFLKDLKAGNVDSNDMRILYGGLGATAATHLADDKTTGKTETDAAQARIADNLLKRKDIKTILTPKEIEALNHFKQDIKDPAKKAAAEEALKKIEEKVNANDKVGTKTGASGAIDLAIQNAEKAPQFEETLKKLAEELNGSPLKDGDAASDAAKKRILDIAGSKLTEAQKAALKKDATKGGLVSQIPGMAAIGAPAAKEPNYVPPTGVTGVPGEDGTSVWDYDAKAKKWVPSKTSPTKPAAPVAPAASDPTPAPTPTVTPTVSPAAKPAKPKPAPAPSGPPAPTPKQRKPRVNGQVDPGWHAISDTEQEQD